MTCTSGDAFATDSYTFERLQRIANSCERVYHRTLKELQRLQEAQPVARADGLGTLQPEQSKPAFAEMGSIRQFQESPQTQPSNPNPNPGPEAENTPPDRPQSDAPKSA